MSKASSSNRVLDSFAASRVQKLTQRITWLSDRLDLSEPAIVDVSHLRHLPEGTFGRAWADMLDTASLEPMTNGPRRLQLHDGIHVLTGYGTDPLGEAQVQAFLMGTKFRLFHGLLLSPMVIAVALFNPIADRVGKTNQFTVQDMIGYLYQAYQRGCNSKLDPDHWQPEYLWYFSLADVQAMLQV